MKKEEVGIFIKLVGDSIRLKGGVGCKSKENGESEWKVPVKRVGFSSCRILKAENLINT